MLLVAIIFGMVAFGYSTFFVEETYQTTVKLYVNTTDENKNGSYDNLNSYNYATKLVNTYIEMLETNNFYSQVATDLHDEYTTGEIKSMVDFSSNDTEVFSATISATSPKEAKEIADSVTVVAPLVISKLNDHAELKIVDPAIYPTYPSSPNVTQNTLIAFFVGFLIALIYTFVKDFLDVKIKFQSDITTICDYPILAAIPDFSESAAKHSEHYNSEANAYISYTSYVKESGGK